MLPVLHEMAHDIFRRTSGTFVSGYYVVRFHNLLKQYNQHLKELGWSGKLHLYPPKPTHIGSSIEAGCPYWLCFVALFTQFMSSRVHHAMGPQIPSGIGGLCAGCSQSR